MEDWSDGGVEGWKNGMENGKMEGWRDDYLHH